MQRPLHAVCRFAHLFVQRRHVHFQTSVARHKVGEPSEHALPPRKVEEHRVAEDLEADRFDVDPGRVQQLQLGARGEALVFADGEDLVQHFENVLDGAGGVHVRV